MACKTGQMHRLPISSLGKTPSGHLKHARLLPCPRARCQARRRPGAGGLVSDRREKRRGSTLRDETCEDGDCRTTALAAPGRTPSTYQRSPSMADYGAQLLWLRGEQDFLGNRYSRRHLLRFDGGVEIAASSSPHVVPYRCPIRRPWTRKKPSSPHWRVATCCGSCRSPPAESSASIATPTARWASWPGTARASWP